MNSPDELPGGDKPHSEYTIYISNLSEDVWPFINAMSDPVERQKEIDENATLSDRDLFTLAQEDNILLLTPRRISDSFLNYYRQLTGKKNFRIIAPATHSGEICRDIIKDRRAFEAVVDAANSSRKLSLVSYSTTIEFLRLAEELRGRGIEVLTPESPGADNAWTVNFYGSKSGIRQLAQQSVAVEPDFVMPDGIILVGIEDAARVAAKWYIKNNGVVIKTNKGHSGAGLLIFRPGDLPLDYGQSQKQILDTLKKDRYWNQFPIIIEDFIVAQSTVGGGFPNAEYRILKNGHIDFLYYCSLRVTAGGVFKGIEVHRDVIADKPGAQIVDTGFFIGERLAAAGYRGYYDVDFVAAKSGKLYVTESNVRRTGGTHVYHTAVRLFGKDFMYETFTLSNNMYELPRYRSFTFEQIYDMLQPVLYDKTTKEVLIISSENVLSMSCLGYIIFGKTRKRAMEIEEEMMRLLQVAETS
ncbi:hypothetical protein A2154_00485 [Candidatus Gottesmanbacteria bacterium RBG_16_43_7]|uniref:ATP-grasp domain-containing protein n=1 Tax=Candidatus Gottesmanbacteria bacterium RBG_16_43_7 TaxID=1798373 RepID=A0A1F5Z804_9BACT|nr:MAG: hypothetical protein A2154_00485 [Candidatus Gottesmanbacteria bacterium RBG_16_43_7]